MQCTPVQKKWRLFRAWATRHPIWCAWQVTYRCNFRCKFCGYWHDPMGKLPEPSVEQFEDASRKLGGYGSLLVSLAGGEPLLRDDLPDIVRAVGRYHFPFVTTNGWHVTAERARDLMRAGVWGVSVSIDYDNADAHDHKRSRPGAWEAAWEAVRRLDEARVHPWQRVNVMAVLLEDNIDHLDGIIRRAARHNAYFMIQPYGQLKTGSTDHVHTDGPVSPRLLDLHRRHRNFLSNHTYLSKFDRFLAEGIPGCKAGRAFFNIDSTGDVAICVERKGAPIANLYHDTPQQVHRRLREASRINPCTSCWYNCRGEVEMLYHPRGVFQSLPTLFFDRGRAPARGATE